jgi:hypothetical protein
VGQGAAARRLRQAAVTALQIKNIGCTIDNNSGAEVAALVTTACSSSGILYSDDYVESFWLREYLSCGVVEKVILSTSSHSLITQRPGYFSIDCFLLS